VGKEFKRQEGCFEPFYRLWCTKVRFPPRRGGGGQNVGKGAKRKLCGRSRGEVNHCGEEGKRGERKFSNRMEKFQEKGDINKRWRN